jgi:tetratricopeptide (TPR) repeat protein
MRFGRGEFGDALDLHGQALSTALRGDDVEGQALAHHGLCESYFFVGPLEDGLEHGLLADAQFRELGQRSMVAHNGYMVAWLLGFAGRREEAMAYADGSIETSHEIGNVREEGFGLFDRAELYLSAGRLDAALADGVRGTAMLRDLGVVRGVIIGENIENSVAAEAWAFERMREPASDALELSDELGGTFMRASTLAYRAWTLLTEGKADEAEDHLTRARAVADVFLHRAWMNRIEVLIQEWAGDADALAEIADRIERDVLPGSAYWGMWGPYARALSASHRGRPADAARDARTALEMAVRFGDRRLIWRAARVAWRAALELGEPEEAERFREQAHATAEQIAADATGDLADGFRARPDVAEVLA